MVALTALAEPFFVHRPLDDFVELTTIQPHPAAYRAVIDLDTHPLGFYQGLTINGAFHLFSLTRLTGGNIALSYVVFFACPARLFGRLINPATVHAMAASA